MPKSAAYYLRYFLPPNHTFAKIQFIKLLVDNSDLGLKGAKDTADTLARGHEVPFTYSGKDAASFEAALVDFGVEFRRT